MESNKQNIVIIGAGAVGSLVVKNLVDQIDHSRQNLILIDSRPFHYWIPAGPRILATDDDDIIESALIPYDRLIVDGKGSVKTGKVVAIEEMKGDEKGSESGQVILDNNERIAYDALILATGSRWPEIFSFPDSKESFLNHVNQWRDKFKTANDVIIIGGGSVGIEISGELRDQYPTKKVTIVHNGSLLLNSAYPDKLRRFVGETLRNKNINFILDDFVTSIPESGSGEVTLRSGKTLFSDCVVQTTGPRPNTEFIASSLGPETLSPNGFVKITPGMQLPSHPSIFAVGDIIDWDEQKQCAKADSHAKVLVPNVISFLAGREPSAAYKGSPESIFMTIGKNSGVSYVSSLWGIVLGPWFTRTVKSGTVFIPLIRQRLGYFAFNKPESLRDRILVAVYDFILA